MKQVIFILLLVGLAYLGSVQVVRFLCDLYLKAKRLHKDLRLFFKERGKDKVVVTIRIPVRIYVKGMPFALKQTPMSPIPNFNSSMFGLSRCLLAGINPATAVEWSDNKKGWKGTMQGNGEDITTKQRAHYDEIEKNLRWIKAPETVGKYN